MLKFHCYGYRLEVQPGEYHFMIASDYDIIDAKHAYRTWELHTTPQKDGPIEPIVYRNRHWLQPKHVYRHTKLDGFIPLYLGPLVNETKFQEKELYEYPGIIEMKLKHDFPHLYK